MTVTSETVGVGSDPGKDMVSIDESELKAAIAALKKEVSAMDTLPSSSSVAASPLAGANKIKSSASAAATAVAATAAAVVDNAVNAVIANGATLMPPPPPPPPQPSAQHALNRLREVCKRLRVLSTTERDALLKPHGLTSLPRDSLLEVSAVERVSGEHGPYATLTYAMTDAEGKRKEGRVNVSTTVAANPMLEAPCLCLYRGEKTSRNGRSFYDVVIAKASSDLDKEGLRRWAAELRKMSPRAMLARLSTQMLEQFGDGTVFIFKNKHKRKLRHDNEPALVVDYETEVDGESVEGTVIVPARLEKDIDAAGGSGVMIFLGRRTSAIGRVYNDIRVVSTELLATM
jgi:hypothetical protein